MTNNYPVQYLLRLAPEQAQKVSEFRAERQYRSESEAFRTLLNLGLRAAAAEQGAPA